MVGPPGEGQGAIRRGGGLAPASAKGQRAITLGLRGLSSQPPAYLPCAPRGVTDQYPRPSY